jgi:hypothetical protein
MAKKLRLGASKPWTGISVRLEKSLYRFLRIRAAEQEMLASEYIRWLIEREMITTEDHKDNN